MPTALYWSLFTFALTVLTVVGWDMLRVSHRDVRRQVLRHERRRDFRANALWTIHREEEFLLAVGLSIPTLAERHLTVVAS